METFKKIGIVILSCIITVAVIYGVIRWDAIVGKWQSDADREVFKETTQYNEAAASFLADSWKQYNDAKTDEEKETIMEYVIMRYPNLDTSNIDNKTLRNFYNNCLDR